ncbi:MAG: NAD(P)/FAD-dependent oxidoreductase [Clostridiales bacterium]|nr:NAD(P)/FAD-dependent oxidoreductase [Clostridiales bacterium]
MKQYVIIGNGIAAAGIIEGIRSIDTDGSVTVISGEKYPVYCRPLISYYLEGKTALDHMGYRPEDFYEKSGCTVLYGKRAERIDPALKTVSLDDGALLPYDSLCAAVGSEPFIPGFEGLDTVNDKFTFMTLDDALSLERAVSERSHVLIVGAGLTGLKCAEGLAGRAKSITVCDLAKRVLPSILDDETAAMVQKRLEKHTMKFLLGDCVARFDGQTAYMESGQTIEFDVLVLAVGVRPNTALIKDAGGGVGRGVQVDTSMATTLPDIYAAGDCTECVDVSSGVSKVLAIMPNAYMQGKCAGINMAGGGALFDYGIAMNSTGLFGMHIMTAGSYPSEDEGGSVYEERTDSTLKRLFVRDGKLTGFMLIGCIERAGIYTRLIREQIPLCTFDFDMIKKAPSLFSLGNEYRRKILGGVV